MRWDPTQYSRYAGQRGRPFVDLLTRVGTEQPRRVVDLGCGPGDMTELLSTRWPDAVVEGIDSSAEMIAAAAGRVRPQLSFAIGEAATWTMPADTDVLFSNALLQWVPGHDELLTRWAGSLPVDGWLAFQVPGNFDSPSHTIMRSLAESPRWAERLAGVLRHADAVATPSGYAALLQRAGLVADVWETTYLHMLSGPDPVLEWVRGTGLRPVLAALSTTEADEFTTSYAAKLRAAYPTTSHGTLLPFRRIFAVGHKAS